MKRGKDKTIFILDLSPELPLPPSCRASGYLCLQGCGPALHRPFQLSLLRDGSFFDVYKLVLFLFSLLFCLFTSDFFQTVTLLFLFSRLFLPSSVAVKVIFAPSDKNAFGVGSPQHLGYRLSLVYCIFS